MIGVSVQVSVYPLRQAMLSPTIEDVLQIFRKHGLDVEPGAMSSLITGDDVAVFSALQEAFRSAAEHGELVMVATFSNACPTSKKEGKSIAFQAIGSVKNDFEEPTTPEEIRATESQIILKPAVIEGLTGMEPGQQLMILFHFHRSQNYELLQHPRGNRDRPRRGVFTLRSPRRPNPIGVTVVDLLAIEGNVLRVRGLDAIDGTPVLDIKPA